MSCRLSHLKSAKKYRELHAREIEKKKLEKKMRERNLKECMMFIKEEKERCGLSDIYG